MTRHVGTLSSSYCVIIFISIDQLLFLGEIIISYSGHLRMIFSGVLSLMLKLGKSFIGEGKMSNFCRSPTINRKYSFSAKFCPGQYRFPIPKGATLSSCLNFPFSSMNRSGLNSDGCGKCCGSFITWNKLEKIVVPFGMMYFPTSRSFIAEWGSDMNINDTIRKLSSRTALV